MSVVKGVPTSAGLGSDFSQESLCEEGLMSYHDHQLKNPSMEGKVERSWLARLGSRYEVKAGANTTGTPFAARALLTPAQKLSPYDSPVKVDTRIYRVVNQTPVCR